MSEFSADLPRISLMPDVAIMGSSSAGNTGMTVVQLEEQLHHLRESTKGALLSSWEEAESLQAKVESLQVEAADQAMKASKLEMLLCQAKKALVEVSQEKRHLEKKYGEALLEIDAIKGNRFEEDDLLCGPDASIVLNHLESNNNDIEQTCSSSNQVKGPTPFLKRVTSMPNFLQPQKNGRSLQDTRHPPFAEIKMNSKGISLEVDECQKDNIQASSTLLGVIGSILLGRSYRPSVYDEDLMKQLAILEEAKKETESELKLKLQQREAAISTLERTTQLQCQTISELRANIDRLGSELTSMAAMRGAETTTFPGTMMVLLGDESQQPKNDHNIQQRNFRKFEDEGTDPAQDHSRQQIQLLPDELNCHEIYSGPCQSALMAKTRSSVNDFQFQ